MMQATNHTKCKIYTKSCVTDYQKGMAKVGFFGGRRGDHLTGEVTSEDEREARGKGDCHQGHVLQEGLARQRQ